MKNKEKIMDKLIVISAKIDIDIILEKEKEYDRCKSLTSQMLCYSSIDSIELIDQLKYYQKLAKEAMVLLKDEV